MQKFLAAVALLAVLILTVSVAPAQKVYFGDTGHDKIRRCDLNGLNLEELVTTGLGAVASIAIDRTAGKMYWADWGTAEIKRASLDGSNIEILLSGLSGPFGLALDVASGKMYWTEFSAQVIRRANLDGSSIEDLITAGLNHPNGIALDLGNGKMYFTAGATSFSGKVQRANLDGSSVEDLVASGLVAPMEIALDIEAGKMYWCDLGADKVQRSNLDGSSVEDLVTGLNTPVGIDLDLAAGKVYFSDSGPGYGKIQRCNLDGTTVQDIVPSGIGSCYGLALGPAVADCSDASLDGPWLVRITGAASYDYTIYLIFDGQGTIDEIGSFSTPDSAGEYSVEPNCDISGYIWSDGYTAFTGHVDSDTTAEISMGELGPFDLWKVRDVGALEGCWEGWFIQDVTGTIVTVELTIDEFGSIQSSVGLIPPVSGKFFFEAGYLAGHIITGDTVPWAEINIREATVIGGTTMTGTFGLDCSECPGGTFTLRSCVPSGVEDRTPVVSSELFPNYPNPFNPRTTIAYSLREAGRVNIRIYDAAGHLVDTLVDESKIAGEHKTIWDGRDKDGIEVGSGVYFVRFESGGDVMARKIVFLK